MSLRRVVSVTGQSHIDRDDTGHASQPIPTEKKRTRMGLFVVRKSAQNRESIMSRMPTERTELPEYTKAVLTQENPSRFFTMNKEQTAEYVNAKAEGMEATKYTITRAIYDGKLASKRIGKKRLVSEYDALVWLLSGREHFGQDDQASA